MAQTSGFDPTTQVKTFFDCKMFAVTNVRNLLPSNGGPIGPLGSEVQWPLLKLDGPKLFKNFFLTNCLFNLLKVTCQKDTKVIYRCRAL